MKKKSLLITFLFIGCILSACSQSNQTDKQAGRKPQIHELNKNYHTEYHTYTVSFTTKYTKNVKVMNSDNTKMNTTKKGNKFTIFVDGLKKDTYTVTATNNDSSTTKKFSIVPNKELSNNTNSDTTPEVSLLYQDTLSIKKDIQDISDKNTDNLKFNLDNDDKNLTVTITDGHRYPTNSYDYLTYVLKAIKNYASDIDNITIEDPYTTYVFTGSTLSQLDFSKDNMASVTSGTTDKNHANFTSVFFEKYVLPKASSVTKK